MTLEIFTDASIRKFDKRTFGCSGAIAPLENVAKYTINPDSTNNRSELVAVYLGIQLAIEIRNNNPTKYTDFYIYSDSQFSIFGLTKWIYGWIRTSKNGIMYGSNGQPVKNQDLFKMILSYLVLNKIKIHFFHQAGHVKYTNIKALQAANEVFHTSNGFYLRPEDIFKISFYNDIVDKTSRAKLDSINPDEYITINKNNMSPIEYVLPKEFKNYVE